MDKTKVLIVEDELIAAEFLKEILLNEGVEVTGIVDTGKKAISEAISKKPDVIFMDIMLRDNISGSEAAVQISRQIDTDIIFVTAYSDPEMIEYAVESHAAGYLSKPYNETEIIATLRLAVARHKSNSTDTAQVAMERKSSKKPVELVDGYSYHPELQRLLKDGKEVELGSKSLKLITLLSRHPDISISNEQIMLHIWGEVVNEKTLRSLLYRTRYATSENLIQNVSGAGYKICSHP